jgi:metallo-beta-lactamase family protein
MRIQFCGADRTVTGSCHLLEILGVRILLDVGIYQGPRDVARRLNEWLPKEAPSVDFVILSHGHLDHCGKLPVLTRAGYKGPIFCTAATAAVTKIVLSDSAQIQQEDASYLNKRERAPGEEPVRPLYTPADLPAVWQAFKTVKLGAKTPLKNGISFTLFDAGHILGSAYVVLEWSEQGKNRRLLFTADIGRYNSPIIRDPETLTAPVDLVITESTYGNARHAPMEEVAPQLLETVRQCIRDQSRMLVPSFAVGRTQTILWYVQQFIARGEIPPIPIYVDSPMGVEASRVYSQYREGYDEETNAAIGEKDLFGTANVSFASSSQDSRKINGYRGACVIIASSPTCEFGRILHHLKFSVENPKDVVVFVGWTPPGTLGRRLQDGQRRVRIFDRWYDVKCQVKTIHGLSAHADGDELMRFLAPTIRPETAAFVVHGEELQAECFANRLLAAGMGRSEVPAMESSLVLYEAKEMPIRVAATETVKAED